MIYFIFVLHSFTAVNLGNSASEAEDTTDTNKCFVHCIKLNGDSVLELQSKTVVKDYTVLWSELQSYSVKEAKTMGRRKEN